MGLLKKVVAAVKKGANAFTKGAEHAKGTFLGCFGSAARE
jgi:hypothetical protein